MRVTKVTNFADAIRPLENDVSKSNTKHHLAIMKQLSDFGDSLASRDLQVAKVDRFSRLLSKGMLPLYEAHIGRALKLASAILHTAYHQHIDPPARIKQKGNFSSQNQGNWLSLTDALLRGILAHLDSDAADSREFGPSFFPVACSILSAAIKSKQPTQWVKQLCNILTDAAAGCKPNIELLRLKSMFGSSKLGELLSSTHEFLVLEALLELLSNMLPSSSDKKERNRFLSDLRKGLELETSVVTGIQQILENASQGSWEKVMTVQACQAVETYLYQVNIGILVCLSQNDMNYPQPFPADEFQACDHKYRLSPPFDRIFVDQNSFIANVSEDVGELDTFQVPFSAMTSITPVMIHTAARCAIEIDLARSPVLSGNPITTVVGSSMSFRFVISESYLPLFKSVMETRGMGYLLSHQNTNPRTALSDQIFVSKTTGQAQSLGEIVADAEDNAELPSPSPPTVRKSSQIESSCPVNTLTPQNTNNANNEVSFVNQTTVGAPELSSPIREYDSPIPPTKDTSSSGTDPERVPSLHRMSPLAPTVSPERKGSANNELANVKLPRSSLKRKRSNQRSDGPNDETNSSETPTTDHRSRKLNSGVSSVIAAATGPRSTVADNSDKRKAYGRRRPRPLRSSPAMEPKSHHKASKRSELTNQGLEAASKAGSYVSEKDSKNCRADIHAGASTIVPPHDRSTRKGVTFDFSEPNTPAALPPIEAPVVAGPSIPAELALQAPESAFSMSGRPRLEGAFQSRKVTDNNPSAATDIICTRSAVVSPGHHNESTLQRESEITAEEPKQALAVRKLPAAPITTTSLALNNRGTLRVIPKVANDDDWTSGTEPPVITINRASAPLNPSNMEGFMVKNSGPVRLPSLEIKTRKGVELIDLTRDDHEKEGLPPMRLTTKYGQAHQERRFKAREKDDAQIYEKLDPLDVAVASPPPVYSRFKGGMPSDFPTFRSKEKKGKDGLRSMLISVHLTDTTEAPVACRDGEASLDKIVAVLNNIHEVMVGNIGAKTRRFNCEASIAKARILEIASQDLEQARAECARCFNTILDLKSNHDRSSETVRPSFNAMLSKNNQLHVRLGEMIRQNDSTRMPLALGFSTGLLPDVFGSDD